MAEYRLSQQQQRALTEAVIEAQSSEVQTGLWASLSVAQWALESAWGSHAPSNNPFGIKWPEKGASGWQLLWTHEYVTRGEWEVFKREHPEAAIDGSHLNGQMLRVKCQAKFSCFRALADAFTVHGRMLTGGRHYASHWEAHKADADPFGFLKDIANIYATDPEYFDKVAGIIKNLNLTRFDRANVPQRVDA